MFMAKRLVAVIKDVPDQWKLCDPLKTLKRVGQSPSFVLVL